MTLPRSRTVSAEICADAAVVGHHVQAVVAVHGRVHGAHRFARGVLAMLAGHRLVHHARLVNAHVLVARVHRADKVVALLQIMWLIKKVIHRLFSNETATLTY